MPLIRSAQAARDLDEVWRYVAEDSPNAADRLLDEIEDAFRLLAAFPLIGPSIDDLRPGLRYRVSGRYLVLYRTIGKTVEIVRVVHGSRDLGRLLDPKSE